MSTRCPALLFVILVAAFVPGASAASASYSTKIIVSLKFPAFHGKLKSGRSACATGRTVKLFRKKPGTDKLLGTDRSNAAKKWSIPIGKRLASGASYYVKAPAKGSCKPAKSKTIAIG